MSKVYDIVIVGAGLAGSTLALWLAKHTDYRVAIVEQSAQLIDMDSPNQRVVALGRVATDLLRDVGVFTDLGEAYAYPYQRMCVWDENSDGRLEFHADDTDHDQLGFMVDALQCTSLLQASVQEHPQIEAFFNCSATALQLDGDSAELEFANSGSLYANLLVAADGARSWARTQAKIFANRQSYGQYGIVARIHTELPHEDCAWQRFLSSGPIAILPLANNESSIVWSADTKTSEALMALNEGDFTDSLSEALQRRLGNISLLSARQAFPLQSLRADRYYRRNLVLVGDAAHSIHPLAGQGANLGFKDVVSLGGVLKAAGLTELGSPNVLDRFERARRPDNQQVDTLMTALYSVYRNNSPLSVSIRAAGMNWLNRTTVLRRLMVDQAIGM